MWAGLRGNQRDAATAALIFSGFAAWGASANGGALLATGFNRSYILLANAFGEHLVGIPLLGATINSHRDTEARLLTTQLLLKRQFNQTQLAFKTSSGTFKFS